MMEMTHRKTADQRTDALDLQCWDNTSRYPLAARIQLKSSQKRDQSECSTIGRTDAKDLKILAANLAQELITKVTADCRERLWRG